MDSDAIGVVSVSAFVCEIAMLVALAVGGWALSTHPVVQVLLAVALPAVAIALWAFWLAPTGAHRLPDPVRFIVQAALFAATGALLAATHRPWWGVAFAVVAIAVFALSRRFA